MAAVAMEPIGYVRSPYIAKYDAPRQPGADDRVDEAVIELLPHRNLEQAVEDLIGFERIWVIAWFDQYLVDGVVNFFGLATLFGGQSLRYSTSGQSQAYALTILLGIAIFGVLLCFPLLAQLSVVFASGLSLAPLG